MVATLLLGGGAFPASAASRRASGPRRRALALLALLAAAGPVAGCAGNVVSANRYVDATNAVERSFAVDIDRLTAGPLTRAALAQYAAAGDRLMAGLRAIAPPARVRAQHARLLAAAAAFRAAIADAMQELAPPHPDKVLAQLRLSSAVTDVLRSLDATSGAINRALHGS